MPQQDIHNQIKALHETIQDTKESHPESQEMLTQLEADIRPIIEQPESLDHQSFSERLELALTQFGANHPTLSTQMTTLVGSLSNMGL